MRYLYNKRTILIVVLMIFCTAIVWAQQSETKRQYTSVTPNYTLTFPKDFGAHPDFRIEWWYVTGWLETNEQKTLGFQITFFRSATSHDQENPSQFAPKHLIIAHAAISDPSIGKIIYEEKSARAGFDLAYAKEGDTHVKLDNWYFVRNETGNYQTKISTERLSLQLSLNPTQEMMLQGKNGFSRKGPNIEQASYYYSQPHLKVTGTIKHQNKTLTVSGHAWLDHEWSSELLDARADGWDWVSMNLFDGSALVAFQIRGKDGTKLWAYAQQRNMNGKTRFFDTEQVDFMPVRTWQSPHTNAWYPVEMRIRTSELEWQLIPLFDDQELDSRSSTGAAYWEGAVSILKNQQIIGQGYLELTGYEKSLDL
ncbi:MAG: carotenoid 1,2-hydratase [Nitrosomonas sp.]|nr:carotenoid 1,2-hydratase [Nitrosomonas sp.]